MQFWSQNIAKMSCLILQIFISYDEIFVAAICSVFDVKETNIIHLLLLFVISSDKLHKNLGNF